MNFYQSPLRKHINQNIYKKPIFTHTIRGEEYFGIIKEQKKLGKTFRRYMLHGVTLGQRDYYDEDLVASFHAIRRDYHHTRGDVFFQLGCRDVLSSDITHEVKDDAYATKLGHQRTMIASQLQERYGLLPSWRRHMPDATIQLDLTRTLPELKKDFSSSGKRYYNKAKKQDLDFVVAGEKEWLTFREMRYAMSYDKGIHIIPQEQFLELMDYLSSTKQGTLLLATKDGAIVSGQVLLHIEQTLIYLYGATDRSYGNIGAHYRLMYETMRRGRKHDFVSLDLLGVAPPGAASEHDLSGVTRFKQALGGTTIGYLGNYDIVFNSFAYTGMKMLKQ